MHHAPGVFFSLYVIVRDNGLQRPKEGALPPHTKYNKRTRFAISCKYIPAYLLDQQLKAPKRDIFSLDSRDAPIRRACLIHWQWTSTTRTRLTPSLVTFAFVYYATNIIKFVLKTTPPVDFAQEEVLGYFKWRRRGRCGWVGGCTRVRGVGCLFQPSQRMSRS